MEADVLTMGQPVETRLSLLEDYRKRAEKDFEKLLARIDKLLYSSLATAILLLIEIVLHSTGLLPFHQ
jgi:hypothetical protein